jgi:hypothetical protein
MPTNIRIIKSALRDLGVLPAGREPTAVQAQDALEALEDIVFRFAEDFAQPWIDQDVTGDVQAEEGDRIRVNSLTPVTVVLPVDIEPRERIVDCCGSITVIATCDHSRAPKDRARVWICDVYNSIDPALYVYRADHALWVKGTNMTLTQECPYADANGFSALLAIKLSASYDVPVPPSVSVSASRGLWTAASTTVRPPGEYW